MPMFLIVLLGLIAMLLLICITYIIPIVLIILAIKGIAQAWVFLMVWFIGFTITQVIKEVKDDNKKSRK